VLDGLCCAQYLAVGGPLRLLTDLLAMAAVGGHWQRFRPPPVLGGRAESQGAFRIGYWCVLPSPLPLSHPVSDGRFAWAAGFCSEEAAASLRSC